MRARGNDLVRFEPQRKFVFPEDLVALGYQLHCEGLLPEVVICLHDDSQKLPCFEAREGTILPDALLLFPRRLQENLIEVAIVEEVD